MVPPREVNCFLYYTICGSRHRAGFYVFYVENMNLVHGSFWNITICRGYGIRRAGGEFIDSWQGTVAFNG